MKKTGAAHEQSTAQTPQTGYVCADTDGRLPGCAPLANPFVPFQQAAPEQYQPPKALIRGTLYPALDLPFRGMVNKTEFAGTALVQIQELGFALRELGLYLDTHEADTEAADLFNRYAEQYEDAMAQYQKDGGSLTQLQAAMGGTYVWLREPWPWEFREEG